VADESLSNVRDVRAFAREKFQHGLYSDEIEKTYVLGAKQALLYGIFVAFMGLFGSSSVLLVLWYGAKLVLNGEMSPGVLTSFVLYTLTVAAALVNTHNSDTYM
jgi:ABC-type bacteriocin/lantibiotic exporter with double-glycine peptidase domain